MNLMLFLFIALAWKPVHYTAVVFPLSFPGKFCNYAQYQNTYYHNFYLVYFFKGIGLNSKQAKHKANNTSLQLTLYLKQFNHYCDVLSTETDIPTLTSP